MFHSPISSFYFNQIWCRPLCMNDRIISFPVRELRDKNETELPKCIHSFDYKRGILEILDELKYPSWFECNNRCQFACNPSKSEIFVLPVSQMGVDRINIIDMEQGEVRKSAIKLPSYPISGYRCRATIIPNKDQVSLIVDGYHRQLTTENESIPILPVPLVKLVMKYYSKEVIFFLNICEKEFCYSMVYLDEILNSTPQDNLVIDFKYASR